MEMEQNVSTATAIDNAYNLNSIGHQLYKQQKYDEALAEYRRALNIRESLLGKNHTDAV